MCRAMEDMRNQTLHEGMVEVARKLQTSQGAQKGHTTC